MKALSLAVGLTAVLSWSVSVAQAQYKAPSQYFPKNSPPPASRARPGAPAAAPEKPAAAVPQQLKFKELPPQTAFFFRADTNRAYEWTKVSATEAKNTRSGTTQVIHGEIPVLR